MTYLIEAEAVIALDMRMAIDRLGAERAAELFEGERADWEAQQWARQLAMPFMQRRDAQREMGL
jgi:hypothetical protein